ncbi:sulfate ABC transporter permease subunit CysT [Neomegalonema sp.]|uniref:sulfate ABC transporter permease subunit CysT n=1 Tax=Neomegalonema sp. TaxID=2039713 RepID=UPI00260F8D48|nr:sulfate ABC transporter permease subunit CysT [Neomegalonema sp.]MDD2868330.1 sulfate ABC transporter permease subunit CysT [Neomegalonema sp.]
MAEAALNRFGSVPAPSSRSWLLWGGAALVGAVIYAASRGGTLPGGLLLAVYALFALLGIALANARSRVLPGFRLSLAVTILMLFLIILIPLSAVFINTAKLSWSQIWEAISAPRAVASYKLSFTASLLAAAVNVVFGLILAWIITRYRFPGRKLVDALIDLPFALPTAVAGIALTALYAPNGWFGSFLEGQLGIKVAFSQLGVLVALTFIGLPFVVRTVQPVLEDLDTEYEEAAASLGASRAQTVWKVVLPALYPALLTGFAMAFARALGEYGSVIFIAGNIPLVSEITPLIIITKLEQYDYAGATAIAAVMLIVSFALLLAINALQVWSSRRTERS